MTEPTTRRQITGLIPRAGEFDVTGLTRDTRQVPESANAQPADPAPLSNTGPRPVAPLLPPTESRKVNVSVYLPIELRDRARAAYRATAHLHDDNSWSAYVAHAVELLTQAREHEHHHGVPYAPDQQSLTPGRPLG